MAADVFHVTTPAGLAAKDAAEFVGLSVTTLRRLARAGKAPKPVRLSAGRVVWRTSELAAWVDGRHDGPARSDIDLLMTE